jgi:hypothetical protein
MTAAGLQITGVVKTTVPAFEVGRPSQSALTVPNLPPSHLPLPAPEPSSPSLPPAQFLMTTPGYSMPNMYAQGSMPPHQMQPYAYAGPRERISKSALVIVIAALLATAIGVVIALAV